MMPMPRDHSDEPDEESSGSQHSPSNVTPSDDSSQEISLYKGSFERIDPKIIHVADCMLPGTSHAGPKIFGLMCRDSTEAQLSHKLGGTYPVAVLNFRSARELCAQPGWPVCYETTVIFLLLAICMGVIKRTRVGNTTQIYIPLGPCPDLPSYEEMLYKLQHHKSRSHKTDRMVRRTVQALQNYINHTDPQECSAPEEITLPQNTVMDGVLFIIRLMEMLQGDGLLSGKHQQILEWMNEEQGKQFLYSYNTTFGTGVSVDSLVSSLENALPGKKLSDFSLQKQIRSAKHQKSLQDSLATPGLAHPTSSGQEHQKIANTSGVSQVANSGIESPEEEVVATPKETEVATSVAEMSQKSSATEMTATPKEIVVATSAVEMSQKSSATEMTATPKETEVAASATMNQKSPTETKNRHKNTISGDSAATALSSIDSNIILNITTDDDKFKLESARERSSRQNQQGQQNRQNQANQQKMQNEQKSLDQQKDKSSKNGNQSQLEQLEQLKKEIIEKYPVITMTEEEMIQEAIVYVRLFDGPEFAENSYLTTSEGLGLIKGYRNTIATCPWLARASAINTLIEHDFHDVRKRDPLRKKAMWYHRTFKKYISPDKTMEVEGDIISWVDSDYSVEMIAELVACERRRQARDYLYTGIAYHRPFVTCVDKNNLFAILESDMAREKKDKTAAAEEKEYLRARMQARLDGKYRSEQTSSDTQQTAEQTQTPSDTQQVVGRQYPQRDEQATDRPHQAPSASATQSYRSSSSPTKSRPESLALPRRNNAEAPACHQQPAHPAHQQQNSQQSCYVPVDLQYYLGEDGYIHYLAINGQMYSFHPDELRYYHGVDGELYYKGDDGQWYRFRPDGQLYYRDADGELCFRDPTLRRDQGYAQEYEDPCPSQAPIEQQDQGYAQEYEDPCPSQAPTEQHYQGYAQEYEDPCPSQAPTEQHYQGYAQEQAVLERQVPEPAEQSYQDYELDAQQPHPELNGSQGPQRQNGPQRQQKQAPPRDYSAEAQNYASRSRIEQDLEQSFPPDILDSMIPVDSSSFPELVWRQLDLLESVLSHDNFFFRIYTDYKQQQYCIVAYDIRRGSRQKFWNLTQVAEFVYPLRRQRRRNAEQ